MTPQNSPEHMAEVPAKFYPLEVRLSHICKRVMYFKEEDIRQLWVNNFKESCSQNELNDQYRMGEYVAEGAFGKVFKAYHKETGRLVAVKQIAKGQMDEKELEVQTNEIELLRVCDHPNIVRLFDYFEDPINIYLVLEYLEGANLLKYVAKKERLLEP